MLRKIFSVSNIATLLAMLYLYTGLRGVYNLMYPLNQIDTSMYSLNQMVKPYWQSSSNSASGTGTARGNKNKKESLTMKVYLSSNKEFNADFLIDEYQHKQTLATDSILDDTPNENDPTTASISSTLPPKHFPKHDSILLWEEPYIYSTSKKLSKSFILALSSTASKTNNKRENEYDESSSSFQYAVKSLDDADQKEALLSSSSTGSSDGKAGSGTTSEAMNALLSNAGDGIETTSVIISLYKGLGRTVGKISSLVKGSLHEEDDDNERKLREEEEAKKRNRVIVPISKKSSIWMDLMKNSTVQVHVILLRNQNDDQGKAISDNFQQTLNEFRQKQASHNLLSGGTSVVKHDLPHHITKPKRFLYKDIIYILQSYLLQQKNNDSSIPPWEMQYTKPEEYQIYKSSIVQKENGVGYPYWKPEVAVKLVSDDTLYPMDYAGYSGMDVVRVNSRTKGGNNQHPSGYAYLPGLYVDEMGLTSEKYIPLNGTVDALPLRISFDSGLNFDDVDEGDESSSSSGGGGLSPGRWRLLRHLSNTLESQKDLGFEQSDIDDIRRLIADTNVTLLGITILASTLHLLFEFLTFKNDVEFWQGNKDLTGLSVRALFMDFFSQFIVLLFLIEKESSLLMTIPAAAGCLIALWKCQKGAGFKFVKCTKESLKLPVSIWNQFFRLFGYELHAMRLRAAAASKANGDKKDEEKDLATLTEEMDCLATNTIGKYLLLPLVLGYTVHTLMNEEHSGWYSWFITSASAVVYAVGFVMMTPQLFLNYKLKSVAHLPWRVLGYRFVNTFIDDLFAMIIRMPTMARISCFRDDVVFIIYLWQRYLYPVDTSRPVEGGGMDAISQAATTATIDSTEKEGVKQKKE